MAKYDSVNGQWPAGTRDGRDLKPTPQEAIAAARRLYRFAMKRPFTGKVVAVKGRRRGGFFMREDRSGKRMVRTIEVNPDRWRGGWHEVVHMLSHRCAYKLFPGSRQHDPRHAFLEREMIRYVVESGWLEGKLRREPKPAAEVDPVQTRRNATLASIARWTTKAKRADTALRKLRRRLRYYDRKLAA